MFLDSSWPGNIPRFIDYLRDRELSAGDLLGDDPVDRFEVDSASSPDPGQHFVPDWGKPKHLDHQRTDWLSEDVEVPVKELPRVGLSILLGRLLLQLADPEELRQPAPSSAPQYRLGPDQTWSGDRSWRRIKNLTEASVEDLLTAYALGQPPRGGFQPELIETVSSLQDFGASIASLQAGFKVSEASVPLELYGWKRKKGGPQRMTRRRKVTIKSFELSPMEKKAFDLVKTKGLTQDAAADVMEVSKQRVSELLKNIKKKMRGLDEYTRSVNLKRSLPRSEGGPEFEN
jgi:hypothetical protein